MTERAHEVWRVSKYLKIVEKFVTQVILFAKFASVWQLKQDQMLTQKAAAKKSAWTIVKELAESFGMHPGLFYTSDNVEHVKLQLINTIFSLYCEGDDDEDYYFDDLGSDTHMLESQMSHNMTLNKSIV